MERARAHALQKPVLPAALAFTPGAPFLPSTPNAVGEQADRDFH
ncbi:MAG: hypothetical protein ACKO3H_04790 [Verrucomicrobiota bacterium]